MKNVDLETEFLATEDTRCRILRYMYPGSDRNFGRTMLLKRSRYLLKCQEPNLDLSEWVLLECDDGSFRIVTEARWQAMQFDGSSEGFVVV